MKLFSPYLSSSLLHRITQTRACSNDWLRLHPQNDVKAPFAWGEFGLFSGADVIFLRDKDIDTESRLSETLAKGCDGSHWVGFDKEQNQTK
jgi:hypothetical protein